MNQQENWTGGRSSDRGMTEIAILLTLLIFVVFGFVFYFFYQQVADLTEQTRELTMRLTKLEQQAGNARAGGLPVYTRKWSPSGANRSQDIKTENEKPSGGDNFAHYSSVPPKEINTLRVRPDGTVIDTSKKPGSAKAVETSSVPSLQVKTDDLNESPPRKVPTSEHVGPRQEIGNLGVEIRRCAREGLYIVCDLRVSTSSDLVKDVVISNRWSVVGDHKDAIFRVSSFQIGTLGEIQNYRSKAFLDRSLPLDVLFRFYSPSFSGSILKTVQFNIGGKAFAFEDVAIDKIAGVNGPSQDLSNHVEASTEDHGKPITVGDIEVELLGCVDATSYLSCDVKVRNLGETGRDVVVSYGDSFARDPENAVFLSTSFSVGKNSHKQHHRLKVYLSKTSPLMLRYRFYNPPEDVSSLTTAQFNIDGNKFSFSNVELIRNENAGRSYDNTSEAKSKSEKSSRAVMSSEGEYHATIGNIAFDLQRCSERMMYLYCDLKLTNLGSTSRSIVVSKDNSFIRRHDNTSYRVTSFSIGASGENLYHTVAFLRKANPLIIRYRFYDPPSGIGSYETMQFNIDGHDVSFANVMVN
ncbi:hypothetical protein [Roseibium sp. SCP14]|uniref:hypothetical protein n=1 Tax=Roseibium sp. SCP14 TaxID=3141375 RepID=UPI00333DD28B